MITKLRLNGSKIHGTDKDQFMFISDKYPKLKVSLVQAPHEPERLMAYAYQKCIEDRGITNPSEITMVEAKEIAKWVMEGGHTPALETIDMMFDISGMSKVVSHQIVRHRIGVSIGQRTQRANSESYLGRISQEEHYVTPPSVIAKGKLCTAEYKRFMEQVEHIYNRLTKYYGIHQDEARYMIPQGSETSMTFNVIFKALMGVCNTRLCELMQGELVEIAKMMAEAVKEYNPLMGELLKPICMMTGKCNRNENNVTEDYPKGACRYTKEDIIPIRESKSKAYDLTQYSRTASEIGEK